MLSSKYGLPNPVINAIIDYTLIRCDDTLPLKYIEKVASTIVRKKITTAYACCNALYNSQTNKVNKVEPNKVEEKEEITDEELDNLVGDL